MELFNSMKNSWACIFTLVFIISCNNIPTNVKENLELAGKNRIELQKVLDHYKSPKDSLKLKAAYFLIGNMANKYSLAGEQLKSYDRFFDKASQISKVRGFDYVDRINDKFPRIDSLWNETVQKEGRLSIRNLDLQPDLHYITSKFLIENIEYAFKAWQLPWSKHLSFDEFCEYILPYRYGNEVLTSWRVEVFNKYLPLLDTLKYIRDPAVLCDSINRKFKSSWKYSHVLSQYPVTMTFGNLDKIRMGSCTQQAGMGIFVMRALGIPVVHEEVPHYGNRSLGHDFNAVFNKNNLFINFEIGNIKMGDVLRSREVWKYGFPKIYRQTFDYNKESLAVLKSDKENVPPYFLNPNIIDVTSSYTPVTDIHIDLKYEKFNNSKFVYLCIFDDQNWKAVSWARIEGNSAVFKNMGRGKDGIVYLPMYYSEQGFVPASVPVLLDAKGKVRNINYRKKKQEMLLNRKYKNQIWFSCYLLNGEFQGSNQLDFKKAENIYIIQDTLEPTFQNRIIDNPNKFRYVRYLISPNTSGNIAEMAFFNKEEKLEGEIISSNNITSNIDLNVAFDKNVMTYVNTKVKDSVQWVGLDFGEPKMISEISFCPRTDKNNVWIGLNYELFYWNKKWITLGVKKAKTYSLEFESSVSDGLYLLRCLDEGREERIFTYENGKQVWW